MQNIQGTSMRPHPSPMIGPIWIESCILIQYESIGEWRIGRNHNNNRSGQLIHKMDFWWCILYES